MKRKFIELGIDDVELDKENPRIRSALDKYRKEEEISPERIYLALRTGGNEGSALGGFHRLKSSIRAMGNISTPISVIDKGDNNLVCIDGNTRLAIIREFAKNGEDGSWAKIPAMLLEDASEAQIEEIRATAHLVGARQWPAYEKAKYLHDQYYKGIVPQERLLELCGGNKKEQ